MLDVYCLRFNDYIADDGVLPVQSAVSDQATLVPKPDLGSHTLRRRQSFSYRDNRLGPAVLPGADWTPPGRPPGPAEPCNPSVQKPAQLSSASKGLLVPARAVAEDHNAPASHAKRIQSVADSDPA